MKNRIALALAILSIAFLLVVSVICNNRYVYSKHLWILTHSNKLLWNNIQISFGDDMFYCISPDGGNVAIMRWDGDNNCGIGLKRIHFNNVDEIAKHLTNNTSFSTSTISVDQRYKDVVYTSIQFAQGNKILNSFNILNKNASIYYSGPRSQYGAYKSRLLQYVDENATKQN